MQSKINNYLTILVDKKDDYLNSKLFQKDETYFQEALREIEMQEIELLSQEEYDKDMNEFIKTL